MATVRTQRSPRSRPRAQPGTSIAVAGFKSICDEQRIEIRPLTILAGANSSGKSSMMQPLLLLKQTVEASYDPGALLLDGPNVRVASAQQLLCRARKNARAEWYGLTAATEDSAVALRYHSANGESVSIEQMTVRDGEREWVFRPDMAHAEILEAMPELRDACQNQQPQPRLSLTESRGFLSLNVAGAGPATVLYPEFRSLGWRMLGALQYLIHVPAWRGNPERTAPVTAVGAGYPGTFDWYVASVIAHWQQAGDTGRVQTLNECLRALGLTSHVMAKRVSAAQVELYVDRLPARAHSRSRDFVNIADVGFGVSQSLPVLVALLAAQSGQLVYLEEPEIHLHPRAQTAMAQVLADAARRGVRVVAETHSSLLLLGIQTLVAEGKLDPGIVKLHWFTRDSAGFTRVTSADLDEAGAFGDWPEDFGEVILETESGYLDAAEARLARRRSA
jgi:predicted ATPase